MTTEEGLIIVWDLFAKDLEKVVYEYLSLVPDEEPLIYSVECRGYFNLK